MPKARTRISRQQAQEVGLDRYYTGKPCARGHLAQRITLSGWCVECVKIDRAENMPYIKIVNGKKCITRKWLDNAHTTPDAPATLPAHDDT